MAPLNELLISTSRNLLITVRGAKKIVVWHHYGGISNNEKGLIVHSISIKRLSLLAIFTLLLSGCATGGLLNTHKVKPKSLATNGVLFGEFIGGTGAFRSMTMTGTFWLDISGVTYHVDKQNGAFAVSLAPGDYVLERITHESGSVRSSYDIKRRFSVRQGKITSLGGLFLIERDAPEGESLYGNKQGSFNIVQVDNEENRIA